MDREAGDEVLPVSWTIKSFSEIADYQTGRTPARATARYWSTDADDLPWVSISDMKPHGLLTRTAERISPDALAETFRGRLSKSGTLLMSFKLTIGRVATLGVDACHNEAIISIYPKAGTNQKYLEYFLAQVDYTDYQDRAVKGHTLNQEKIDRIAITLPPEPEQEKIAAVLWKLQRAIATQDKLIATTGDLKQSVMQRLFTHGLRGEPLKDTEIGPMPESWHRATLGELAATNGGAIQTGPFGSQLHAREYQPEGVPVVNPTHLSGNRINHESVPRIAPERAADLARHALQSGDVLFARRGQIARHGFVGDGEAGWICGTGCFLVRVCHPSIANEFLPCFFSVPGVVTWLEANAAGAIMPNLNNTVLGNLPVYHPQSKEEQRGIAAALATIDRKLAHHRAKRAALDALFQTTLHQLMTAKVRVADLDIDTSEVRDRRNGRLARALNRHQADS